MYIWFHKIDFAKGKFLRISSFCWGKTMRKPLSILKLKMIWSYSAFSLCVYKKKLNLHFVKPKPGKTSFPLIFSPYHTHMIRRNFTRNANFFIWEKLAESMVRHCVLKTSHPERFWHFGNFVARWLDNCYIWKSFMCISRRFIYCFLPASTWYKRVPLIYLI